MAGVLDNSDMVASPDTTVHEPVPDRIYVKQDVVPSVSNEIRSDSPTEPPKVNKRARPRPDYMRHVKSPFSYVEMITFAIESNPSTMMTLQDIVSFMLKAFYCLRGGYEGWKNSVRHTLSINNCFKKVLRRPDKPSGKDNFWIMNVDCEHCKLSRTENGWINLKVRYQQYVQEVGETVDSSVQHQQLTSPLNQRFTKVSNQKKRSPQAGETPMGRIYQQVEYRRRLPLLMPIAMPKAMHVMDRSETQSFTYPMDLSAAPQNSRKRPSLDDEPLDLSVKRFKTSSSTAATTREYALIQRSSPVSSPNGSCSPDFRSCSPQLLRTNSMRFTRNTSPEHCLFRSEVHFPPNADRTRFLNNMAGRMYEYDQDGRLKMVQTIADARRPIYILSSMPRPVGLHTADGY